MSEPTPSEHARVRELLGREPQGHYEIVVRDGAGDPVVLRNAPFLDDGTPMPTRYWLIAPVEIRRIGRLEAEGGVHMAEAAVDPTELADAHARYAAERDAEISPDHHGPRPSGGVAGTRIGVKCLHAHWAWHLAGGDDPVGRWIEAELGRRGGSAAPTGTHRDAGCHLDVGSHATTVSVPSGTNATLPWGAANLTERWLADADPPGPEALTNALGTVDDHLDDIEREHPEITSTPISFGGSPIEALARVEIGTDQPPSPYELTRAAAEEVFRVLATERSADRAHNPGLPLADVDTIVATCCIVVATMRRFHLDRVVLHASAPG